MRRDYDSRRSEVRVAAVTGDAQRRRELGAFLRTRRQQVVRADLGLPPVGRRPIGLRREEVSYLSKVSVTWYTWLEQGRDITPSRQVLDAVARTLRLSCAEQAYVHALAGYGVPHSDDGPVPPALPAHVQRLLDALDDLPACVLASDWTVLGWTAAFLAIHPELATVPEEDRNLLWLVFTHPAMRESLEDWQLHSARSLAQFRAAAGPRLGEPRFARLIERLLATGEPFRTAWENHDIEGFASEEHTYHHPVVGDLHVEQHRMALSDQPGLHLLIYTPVARTDTSARLRRLTSITSPGGPRGAPGPATAQGRTDAQVEDRAETA